MGNIKTNIKIIREDESRIDYFLEKQDLYSRLSGVKDSYGENMEFIQIGENIQLEDEIYNVIDINLKFEGINITSKHKDKRKEFTPEDLFIEVIITAELIKST